ncbi:MAG: TetR/AcrR family transcriptional regulator [Salinibacterium sp.]|nr:TetR/AcrR family transcriptional regulator [Salinibacterium sp.]
MLVAQGQRERAVRSDSTRNREAILAAAADCLTANPAASLADIALAAGVGRVTLYGHFSSRSDLLHALLHHTMARVESELAALNLEGTAWHALDTLVASSWKLLNDLNALRGVIERELPEAEAHNSHGDPRARVEHLLARGRADGSFRKDQTIEWQTACYFSILHGAASEIREGRLTEAEVQRNLPQTLRLLLEASNGSS